jgi:hypothetical protein
VGEDAFIAVALLCAVGSGCVGSSFAQRTATSSPPTAAREPTSSPPVATIAEHCSSTKPPAVASPAAPPSEGSCQPFLRAKLTAAETKLRKSYKPMYGDSRVIVDFLCDPVEQIGQIELEQGDRRNRTLTFLRFTRPPEGGAYHVVGIEIRASEATPGNEARPSEALELRTVALDLASIALDVQDVRTPLTATINEVQFADQLPAVDSFTRSEIRRLVRLEGRDRHLIRKPDGSLEQAVAFSPVHFERSYTGEAESTTQKDYLPIDLALVPLLAVVPREAFGAATVTEEHRQLFATRFEATFSAAPEWLRELLLGAAEKLGVATNAEPCTRP